MPSSSSSSSTSPPLKLDLTGQASEDEPLSLTSRTPQQRRQTPQQQSGASADSNAVDEFENEEPGRPQSRESRTLTKASLADTSGTSGDEKPSAPANDLARSSSGTHDSANSANPSNTSNSASTSDTASASHASHRGILSRLPSPIDLWHSRTPLDLLLLPLVFSLFLILQLPLHFNSKVVREEEQDRYRGRSEQVDKLQRELNTIEHTMGHIKDDQIELQSEVKSLRRRLGKIRARRERREDWMRHRKEHELNHEQYGEKERKERERELKLMERLANEKEIRPGGPIKTVDVAKPLSVETFVGRTSSAGSKKEE